MREAPKPAKRAHRPKKRRKSAAKPVGSSNATLRGVARPMTTAGSPNRLPTSFIQEHGRGPSPAVAVPPS